MNEQIEAAIRLLESHDYKVLPLHQSVEEFSPATPSEKGLIGFLDFEATGIDTAKDVPVEIGLTIVEYDPEAGTLHRVVERVSSLEDPGFPLSEEVKAVTGLTDEILAGQKFDDERINAALQTVDWVFAHKADYDRPLGERRFPILQTKRFACSLQEGPWKDMGIGPKALEHLAYKVGGVHYAAHRAEADTDVLAHVTSKLGPADRTIFSHILDSARRPTFTVWAQGAPFENKDKLKKDRGYRWHAEGEEGKLPKSWYKTGVTDLNEELQYLADEIFHRSTNVTVDLVTAIDRYSVRPGDRKLHPLPAKYVAPAEPMQPAVTLAAAHSHAEPGATVVAFTSTVQEPDPQPEAEMATAVNTRKFKFRRS